MTETLVSTGAMTQSSFDFAPGLTAQYKTLRQVTSAAVYSARGGLNATAADCDLSPSELTRMLNRGQADERALDLEIFDGILRSTRDLRPIYWLIEKFLQDPERVRAQAAQQLAIILPAIIELTQQAGFNVKSTPTRGKR